MKILFRADSSSDIGTGHIMRDLVLAAQYSDAEILFAVQDLPGNINGKIVEAGYDIEILKSDRMNVLNRILDKYVPDMLVIDHYRIDYWFEKEIKSRYPGLILLSFDDTYEKHYCDILLNHNIYANEAKYDGLVPLPCELKCGSEYTLVREEFRKEKAKGRQNGNSLNTLKVFICMGGTDHTNITPKILAVMQLFPNIHAEVVTTTANAHLSELEAYAANHPNVTLHISTTKMARLMNEAHLAIVTPSVILNEIFYMGVPFVAIKTANNQKFMYEYLLKSGDIALAGFNWGQLREKISLFIKPLRIELINFTDLCLDEKKMILVWRNNDKVRRWMFMQEQIALATHLDYIDFLKNCNNRYYFLVKANDSPKGVIDFTNINFEDKSCELGIYANPYIKGVGNILMQVLLEYAFRELGMQKLIAKVFENNIRAVRLYKRYNFKQTGIRIVGGENVIILELDNENW